MRFDIYFLSFYRYAQFLGPFAKLRKATISFAMSNRPSVLPRTCLSEWNYSASTVTNLHEILYLKIFRKSVKQIQFSLLIGQE